MKQPRIVFVCEHGAAKSILAATYFNVLASQMGVDLQAVARGTNPDDALSPQTVSGLAQDGLTPAESTPQKLSESDLATAQRVIAFCELPTPYPPAIVERWDEVPSVNEEYEQARDIIVSRIRHLLAR